MDRWLRRNRFLLAWILLTLTTAAGFYIQARTIERLEQDEQAIVELVEQNQKQQTHNAEQLCGLLVQIAEIDFQDLIARVFRDLGYSCEPPHG